MASSSRPRLSVAIIVRDSAEPLRLTLASVRDIANEIVVVDTGSTDRSREVAQEFESRVCQFEWCDDFSAARNFALGQVKGDWVLWLDAGETISESDALSLRQFLDSEARPDQAYVLLVRFPGHGPTAVDEQVGRVRLVPNKPGICFSGRIRETMFRSLAAEGVQIQGAPFVIRRDERDLDARAKRRRAQRNMHIAQRELAEGATADQAARLWNCLGESHRSLNESERARECFQQALQAAERGSLEMLEAYYGLLASLYAVGDTGTQLSVCIQAIEVFPLDAQLLCALGGNLHRQNQSQLALKAYLTCYRYGQIQPLVLHVVEIRDIGASCYSLSLQLEKKTDDAVAFLEDAVRDRPDSIRLRRRLIELYVDTGDRDAALAHVNGLPKTVPNLEALRSAVRGACYAAQKNWLAAKAYLSAAYQHGCRDTLCVKWLGISLIGCGETEAARPLLVEWQEYEPGNHEIQRLLTAITPLAKPDSNPRMVRVDGMATTPVRGPIPLNIASVPRN